MKSIKCKNLILVKGGRGINSGLVELLAQDELRKRRFKENVELSVIFVGRKRAQELNRQYRKMSYIPQVLGFPMSKKEDIDGLIRLGDVVICTQKLKYEAKFQRKKVEEVLDEWIKHGIDNLLK